MIHIFLCDSQDSSQKMCQQHPLSASLRRAASSQQLLAPRGVLRGVGAMRCWARLQKEPGNPTINNIHFQVFLNF